MISRLSQGPSVLLAALLVGGGLFLSACTSESPSDATADSTTTSSATASHPTSASVPIPTDLENRKDDRALAEKLSDASVETQVTRALRRASSLRVFPFRPTVIDGHLILRGDVNTPDQYHRAERIAGQVEGVTALTNRLTMGGRPVTEERLAAKKEGASEDDTAVYHTVRQGDTLWDIARKYRASIDQIRNLNDLRSNNLRPGQRIRVR